MTTTLAPRADVPPADAGSPAGELWSPAAFEDRLRAVARERYHDRHPFNRRMHEGDLRPEEVRAWITNRFHYQRHIPVKDALITAKLDDPRLRRMWVRRIEDHDGRTDGEGGIERWLRLGEAAGLDRSALLSGDSVLPGVRLAVEGYVNFCRLRPPLEAVAASLTELTAPDLMRVRIGAFERHYSWIEPEGLGYFRTRVDQGRRDSTEALALVLDWARTREDQQRALAALTFKCEVLWSLLDAVQQESAEDRATRPEPALRPATRPEPALRPWRATARAERTDRTERFARDERTARDERAGRAERTAGDERIARVGRTAGDEHIARAEGTARDERTAGDERAARAARTAGDERIARAERIARDERAAREGRSVPAERVVLGERSVHGEWSVPGEWPETDSRPWRGGAVQGGRPGPVRGAALRDLRPWRVRG